jgi:hypothetical protein
MKSSASAVCSIAEGFQIKRLELQERNLSDARNQLLPTPSRGWCERSDRFRRSTGQDRPQLSGGCRFKRGIKIELGLGAFADASGELSKFFRASIEGTAFARAKAESNFCCPLTPKALGRKAGSLQVSARSEQVEFSTLKEHCSC